MITNGKRFHGMILAIAAAACLSACSSSNRIAENRVFRMGEKVKVGPMTYDVIETEWKSQLGDIFKTRIPNHRFLLIRLTVTNGGGAEVAIPLLAIENGRGESFTELADGEGVTQWLGFLRRIQPAQTEDGRLLFDVPTGAYQLRVTDGGETGKEKTAVIEIPLNLETEQPTLPLSK